MRNTMDNNDLLVFADEEPKREAEKDSFWHVLIVDDEEDIHTTTRLVLDDFEFEGKKLKFTSAYTADEAYRLLKDENDFSVVLLDVVMESNHAGLHLANIIRNELRNNFIRIILRTGQPGEAPERKVIAEYDINDYKNKAELTSQQLFTCMYSALRSYRDLNIINRNRNGLQNIIESTANLFKRQNIEHLAQGVLTQVISLLGLENSYYISTSGFTASQKNNSEYEIIAATGRFESCTGAIMDDCKPIPQEVIPFLKEAVEKGQSGFIGKHYVGYFPTMKDKIHLLFVENCRQENENAIESLLTLFNHNAGIAFDNVILNKEITDTQIDIIYRLGEVVESRSKETAFHVKRVAEYTYTIARALGLPVEEAELYKMASHMHDIGKIGIADSILLKPGKLSEDERVIMKTHTDIGYNMLKASSRTMLKTSAVIAREHHEYWDGTGYPRGLMGEEIHIAARIVCLADIYDALCSKRVYKQPWSEEETILFIKQNTGKIFDPAIVDAFFRVYKRIQEIKEQYRDQ